MNYQGKINLLRLINACVVNIKGRNGSKKGVFIPIEDNHLFVSSDDNNSPKGVYADFIVWENKVAGKFGDTHSFKLSVPKDVREKMTEEQIKAIPYFGSMKPYELQNASASVNVPDAEVEEKDDLPF